MKSKIGVLVLLLCIVLCLAFIKFDDRKKVEEPKNNLEDIRKENGKLVAENKSLKNYSVSLENDIEQFKNNTVMSIDEDVDMDLLRFETEKVFYDLLECVRKGNMGSIDKFFVKDSNIQRFGEIQTPTGMVKSYLMKDDVYYISPSFIYNGIEIYANYKIVKNNETLADEQSLPRVLVIYEKTDAGWRIGNISKG